MKKYIGIFIFILLVSSVYADEGINILDPKDSTLKRDKLEDWITVSVQVLKEGTCSYDYLELGLTKFNCSKGINEFDIYTRYFGEHYVEVKLETNDSKVFTDGASFSVQPSENYVIKRNETPEEMIPANLDTILCFNSNDCLWTDEIFLEYALFIALLILVGVAYVESKKGDKN